MSYRGGRLACLWRASNLVAQMAPLMWDDVSLPCSHYWRGGCLLALPEDTPPQAIPLGPTQPCARRARLRNGPRCAAESTEALPDWTCDPRAGGRRNTARARAVPIPPS